MASRFSELRELEKEEERKARENLRLSKQDTERLLGKNWREREAAKRATPEYRASRAQEALASNIAETRERNRKQLTPLQEDVTMLKMELPGGGTAEFGAGTLANMRAYEQKQKEAKEAQRSKVAESINKMREDYRERNKQRYANELASRGLRNPMEAATPEERRRIEEENSREMMADFRTTISAKDRAARAESQLARDYRDYKQAAKEARKRGAAQDAVYYEGLATDINESVGGNISNVTARRRILEQGAMDEIRKELQARADRRRAVNAKRTTANPEAASAQPTPTAEPTPTSQPPVAPTPEPTATPTPEPAAAPTSSPATQPASETPTAPRVKTSKEVTQEDIQPGISEVAMPPRAEGESVADYNKRSNEEYERQVIIPSFDEETQNALLSAREINNELDSLFRVRFQSKENSNRYKQLQSEVKEKRKVLKDKIKELRSQRRKVAFSGGNEAKFIDQQIATLDNELGMFEKFLF